MRISVRYRCDIPNVSPSISVTAFLIAAAALSAACATAEADVPVRWTQIAPQGAGFTMLMPGAPMEHTATVPTRVGPTVMHIFIVDDARKFYFASYSDYPATGNIFDAKAALCGARDGAARRTEGAVLLKDVDFTFEGYPAKGIVMQILGGKFIYRCRMYLVGTRLYQTVFAAPPAFAHSPSGSKFLNSFQVVLNKGVATPPSNWQLSPTESPPPDSSPEDHSGSKSQVSVQQKSNVRVNEKVLPGDPGGQDSKVTGSPTDGIR